MILKGNICKDIDLKFVPQSGLAVAKFTMAVSRMKKDDPSDFLNCVAFGKTAETIANNLGKGNPILINGHIQTGSYDHKDGHKVYTTDVIVDRFEFIQSKGAGNTNTNTSNESFDNEFMAPVDDGEIPF